MNDHVTKTLDERSVVYGDFEKGIDLTSNLLKLILKRYQEEHGKEMPKFYEICILHLLIKIVRIAVTPTHFDSWIDLSGYAARISNVQQIKETTNASE
jgi:hypothetical protein